MIINANDRLYYNDAVEYVVEQLETARNFVKYNGLSAFTTEDVSDQAIRHVKQWLASSTGEEWLATLGYTRSTTIATASGSLITLADYCPVCSGIYTQLDGTFCECCGRQICKACSVIVDTYYEVEWCPNCVQTASLTNLLPYTE
jgi:hypothetical protein